jgi:rRNA maturation endonuclease Nob1
MEVRKYDEICRRCGEVFETDSIQEDIVCERCQFEDWHERENEQEEVRA